MRWLFRFNVGGERPNDPREMAPGLGHAMRCLALERVVRQDHSADTIFMFDGDSQSKKHMENFGVATAGVEDEEGILNSFRPTIIVLDINYLEPEKILWYRKWAPVINLAPRGLPKFYSDCTFSAFAIDDIPIPVGASDAVLHKGPQYAIVGEDFVKIRLNSDTVHNRRPSSDIVVSMGGKDYHNLTMAVVSALNNDAMPVDMKIIIGPLYPYEPELRELIATSKTRTQILVNPADFASQITDAQLGIFAAGITTYEALCVGVPSLNVNLTRFHQLVTDELVGLGAAINAGNCDDLHESPIVSIISDILADVEGLDAMRRKGLELVDGLGAQRVVDAIVKEFENAATA